MTLPWRTKGLRSKAAAQEELPEKVYEDGTPCLVESVDRWGIRQLTPEILKEGGKVRSFAVSPVHAGSNVIGFFYADNAVSGASIQPSGYDAFLHLASRPTWAWSASDEGFQGTEFQVMQHVRIGAFESERPFRSPHESAGNESRPG